VLGPATPIVSAIITLLILAILIRVVLSYVAGMSYSTAGRYLGLATEWLIAPIRRLVPPLGGIDFSPAIAIILLYAVQYFIQSGNLIFAVISIVQALLVLVILLLFARILFSFFRMSPWHPIVQMVNQGSEPFARPFRGWLPRRRTGFDWAPVVALVVVAILWYVVGVFRPLAF
jgi:YggT family protein